MAVLISGCTSDAGPVDGRDSVPATVSQGVSEVEGGESEGEHSDGREGGDSAGEHGADSGGNGSGKDGSGGDGEHSSGGEESDTGSDGSEESREAAMSSPVTPLGQSWNGVLGGLYISAEYDAPTRSVHATVRNTLPEMLCYVQAEPHLKSGMRTVGELGPGKLGHLKPGQEVTSILTVADEPELEGISYDGYVIHMEVFDCSGPGPAAYAGEGAEGGGRDDPGGEHGRESSGEGGEEGNGSYPLAPNDTYDAVRSGARLILNYDAASGSFQGTVENTTASVLYRVRVEVHLSNGVELDPTTPTDLAPGEMLEVNLSATTAPFTGWTAHAEVGGGEDRSESGEEHGDGGEYGEGREAGGEHRSGAEQGGDKESGEEQQDGGEHGGGG